MHRNELDFIMAKKIRAVQYIKENPHRLLSLDPVVRAPLLRELMNHVPCIK